MLISSDRLKCHEKKREDKTVSQPVQHMEVNSGNPHFMAFNSNSSLKWPGVEMGRSEGLMIVM